MSTQERDCQDLSGGEVQRLAIAMACLPDVNVYIFDEPSSFLDVKQRLAATRLIRSLCCSSSPSSAPPSLSPPSTTTGGATPDNKVATTTRYVIVIEHDLAILDYMSDHVHCLYGEPGAYGVVTKRANVRNGINNFLAGYLPTENMRFRAEELNFRLGTSSGAPSCEDQRAKEMGIGGNPQTKKVGVTSYPAMTKVLTSSDRTSSFTLHIAPGSFEDQEVIGLLGQNGMGKTTFLQLFAGLFDKKVPAAGGGGEDENVVPQFLLEVYNYLYEDYDEGEGLRGQGTLLRVRGL